MSWAIAQAPNDYFFEAAVNITVRVAPPEDVLEFLNSNVDVLHDLLRRVYSGNEGMGRRLAHAMGGSAKNRVLHALIIEARRFGKKSGDGYEINISESKLGASTGLTRETVSRALKELSEEKLIIPRRQHIAVPSLRKLEEYLGSGL
jgi:CRP-like cAMP-binding protein